MRVFVVVLSSDLYCFSCFGFTGENLWISDPSKPSEKCENQEDGNLAIRKCTTNETDLPVCIKFKAKYKLPQMMGKQLVERLVEGHGFHCGKRLQCSNRECPNYWPTDIKTIEECEISCCSQEEPDCKFPVPSPEDVKTYIEKQGEERDTLGGPEAGKRSSDAIRIGLPVCVLAISLAVSNWTNL